LMEQEMTIIKDQMKSLELDLLASQSKWIRSIKLL
jgi:hypothetical protein